MSAEKILYSALSPPPILFKFKAGLSIGMTSSDTSSKFIISELREFKLRVCKDVARISSILPCRYTLAGCIPVLTDKTFVPSIQVTAGRLTISRVLSER